MSEQFNYLPYLSELEPPGGLTRWAARQGNLKQQYIIYRSGWRPAEQGNKKERCALAVCTACHGEMELASAEAKPECWRAQPRIGFYSPETDEPVYSGDEITCPMCGSIVKVRHTSEIGDLFALREWTAQVTRIPAEGKTDRLAIVEWVTERHIDRQGVSRYRTFLWDAYVVEERKLVRTAGYTNLMYGQQIEAPLRQNTKFRNDFGKYGLLWPWDPAELVGTTAENCKLDLYIKAGGRKLVDWLALWRKKPQAENLLVQGYGKMTVDLIDKTSGANIPYIPEINWKEKRPSRMLGMTAEEFRAYRGKLSGEEYLTFKWTKDRGIPLKNGYKDIRELMKLGDKETLLEIVGARDFWRGVRYLSKQKVSPGLLRDYRVMAKKLKLDMTDNLVLWPRDAKKAHDRLTEAYNRAKDEAVNGQWAERAAELTKFAWRMDGIIIRPCASQTELRREGNTLHHCVFSYADRILKGQSAIFFVRHEDKPEEPWYTLELDEKTMTVRQNRGLRNCARTPEVEAFEKAWVGWIKETFGEKKKKHIQKAGIPAA